MRARPRTARATNPGPTWMRWGADEGGGDGEDATDPNDRLPPPRAARRAAAIPPAFAAPPPRVVEETKETQLLDGPAMRAALAEDDLDYLLDDDPPPRPRDLSPRRESPAIGHRADLRAPRAPAAPPSRSVPPIQRLTPIHSAVEYDTEASALTDQPDDATHVFEGEWEDSVPEWSPDPTPLHLERLGPITPPARASYAPAPSRAPISPPPLVDSIGVAGFAARTPYAERAAPPPSAPRPQDTGYAPIPGLHPSEWHEPPLRPVTTARAGWESEGNTAFIMSPVTAAASDRSFLGIDGTTWILGLAALVITGLVTGGSAALVLFALSLG